MSAFRVKPVRTKETKTGINADSARQKRIGQFANAREQDREATLQSRRRRHNTDVAPGKEAGATDDAEIELDRPNMPALIQALDSTDHQVLTDATGRLRRLLSLINNPPFDEAVNMGTLPKLVRLLEHESSDVVFEATWCLTNIASGSSLHTTRVVDAGSIPPLVNLLGAENCLIRDQAVWALGNIAGESAEYRDYILSQNAMPKLLAIAHQVLRLAMLRNVSWTLSNFCRGRDPQPDFEIVSTALPTLHNMLNFRDDDIIADSAWALSFISDDTGDANLPDNHKIEIVLASGVVNRLIALLQHPSPIIKTPALRTIGNIVTGSNFQAQRVISAGVLPPLVSLLSNARKSIRREAIWALSNIAAGSIPQITALMEANAFKVLLHAVANADLASKREVAWVILNAVSRRDATILQHIASLGWIAVLLGFLTLDDSSLILTTLDALQHFLEHGAVAKTIDGTGNEINIYAQILERLGCDQVFEHLTTSNNAAIIMKASDIMSTFLGYVKDDEQDDQVNAFDNDQGMIGFNQDAVGDDEVYDL